ncbi:MAG: hypothetical protein HKL92_02960 [Candidatus Eremiobacteraeota bacterium]|nr:hypothetical protein [Candidatus Eremiobacteraeota bacterium]
MTRHFAALLLALASLTAFANAAVSAEKRFAAVRANVPPPEVASARAAVWRSALVAKDFYNFSVRRPAGLATTARFLYDGKNLYVEFHCIQAGVPITAAQRVDHAGVGSDDHVSFDIDTSGNGSRTYTFRVNPLGVHDESSSENARYAPSWISIAHVSRAGNYDVLMVIPLATIRSQAAPEQQWRLNFERFVAARNAAYTWAYAPAMQSTTEVQYWPWVTQIHLNANATRPKPQVDAYVLGSAGSQRNIFQNGVGRFETTSPRQAGIDLTYPFTNTLAFVGTLNPDFSNVEEDQTTIQLQEFQKAYQEYRPFFAQGAQYIDTVPQIGVFGSNSIFYTPSIGIFNRGMKIEGTAGRSDIGLLNVVGPGLNDNAAGYTYSTPSGSLALSAESVIANHVGVHDMTTGFGFSRTNRASGEGTEVEIADETNTLTGSGHDFNIEEGIRNEHFTAVGLYRDTSPGYAPLDGYTATNDARGLGALLGYKGTGSPHSPIQSYSGSFGLDRYLAYDGSLREADINGFFNIQFKDLISLQGFAGPSELQVAPGTIDWFNRRNIQIGYREGTPNPADVSYSWGPFGGFYVQQWQSSYVRVFGAYGFSFEYDGNEERAARGLPIFNSQWLRRAVLSRSFGNNATIGIALRAINGTGGFAVPGTNLSLLYETRLKNQDLLYVEYGTSAAPQTLHRFIVKYVFHAGGSTGT